MTPSTKEFLETGVRPSSFKGQAAALDELRSMCLLLANREVASSAGIALPPTASKLINVPTAQAAPAPKAAAPAPKPAVKPVAPAAVAPARKGMERCMQPRPTAAAARPTPAPLPTGTIAREDFHKLNPHERMAFMKAGGKLSN